MRFALPSMRRPRHPLARALSLLLGVAVLALLLVFGLVVAGVLLVGGIVLMAIRQWKHGQAPGQPAARPVDGQPAVLEGEFRVINEGRR